MPIAAHSAASAISWVPTTRLSSGPTSATGAAVRAAAVGCETGLGVAAGIDGSSAPTFLPAGVDVTRPPGTIGSNPPGRTAVLDSGRGAVLAIEPVKPAEPEPIKPAEPEPFNPLEPEPFNLLEPERFNPLEPERFNPEALEPCLDVDFAATAATTVADAFTVVLGLAVVIVAASFTCSPLVLDLGTSTAAWSSMVCPLPSLLTVHVVVRPLGHTTKWGAAAAGLLARVTVTPLALAPEDESPIVRFAVPPGFTFALPATTSTLSHSFTAVGAAAMNAAVWIFVAGADEAGVEDADADETGTGGGLLGARVVSLGDGVDPFEADFDGDGEEDGEDDAEFDGDGDEEANESDFDGEGDGDFGGFGGSGVGEVDEVDVDGEGDGDFGGSGVGEVDEVDVDGEGDGDFGGSGVGEVDEVDEVDVDGEGDGDGDGLAGGFEVIHDCAAVAACAAASRVAASGSDSFALLVVNPVVVTTAPATPKPSATPARADPCLRPLTRLTPFLRSSVEVVVQRVVPHYALPISCPSRRCRSVVLAAAAGPCQSSSRGGAVIWVRGPGANVRAAPNP